jgi:hypothetical protein
MNSRIELCGLSRCSQAGRTSPLAAIPRGQAPTVDRHQPDSEPGRSNLPTY